MILYISVNEYSKGFIDLRDERNNILYKSIFGFELPYDIAEDLAHALSFGMRVELEDEYYNNTIYEKGKIIKEERVDKNDN